MAEYLTNTTDLTKVASAIREKGGTPDPLVYPDGFVAAIQAIQTGTEKKIVQVVVKGADPNACSVWDVKQNAWVDYTTDGVTVNVIDYLAVSFKTQSVMLGPSSYIRLKDGTEYNCTGDVGAAWLVGDMWSASVINLAYTSHDWALNVHYNPIKAEDIDYIYIETRVD